MAAVAMSTESVVKCSLVLHLTTCMGTANSISSHTVAAAMSLHFIAGIHGLPCNAGAKLEVAHLAAGHTFRKTNRSMLTSTDDPI